MNAVVTMDAIDAVDPFDPLTIPACLKTGRAGFSQWRPCPLWKHWDLPSLGIQNTKVVYLRHMDSNSTNAPCCAIQVKFSPTSGPVTSSFYHLQWESQSNHGESVGITKKLGVKLTPGKIRCLRVDRARPIRALAFTYKLQSVVDTSNSAWTQVNSEWSHGLRPNRTPATSVFPRCHLGRCLVVRQST